MAMGDKRTPVNFERVHCGVFDGPPEVVRYSTAVQRLRDKHAPQKALDEFERDRQIAAICPTHGPIADPIIGLLGDRVAFGCPECSSEDVQARYDSEGKRGTS